MLTKALFNRRRSARRDPRIKVSRDLCDLASRLCAFLAYDTDRKGSLFGWHGRNQMTDWRVILGFLIGAIIASVITAGVFLYAGTKVLQANTARELLAEVVAIDSLQEGWLLQGEDSQTAKLSDHPGLPETQSGSGLWLMPVEIRVNSGRSPMEFSVRSELRLHTWAQGLDYQKSNIAGRSAFILGGQPSAFPRAHQLRWKARTMRLDRTRADCLQWRDADRSRTCAA